MTHSTANSIARSGSPRSVKYGDLSALNHRARAFLDARGGTLTLHHAPDPTLTRQARLRALALSRGEYRVEGAK